MLPYFKSILEFASLAPSGHNTQPWKFTVEGHYIRISPDFTRRLPVADADDHELFISLGCALENLVLAASHFGYGANVMYDLKGSNPGIILHLYEDNTLKADPLFEYISLRHVNRGEYTSDAIPFEMLHLLQKSVNEQEAQLKLVTTEEQKEKLALLTAVAARMQFRNPAFKEELLQWMRFNSKSANETHDGVPSAAVGAPSTSPAVGRFFFRRFVSASGEAAKAAGFVEQAPALVVLAAPGNNKEAWVKLGRNYERLALTATRYNLSHSHFNMACEEESVRKRLKETLHLEGEPLLLLRFGFAKEELPPAQRRPLNELMTNGTMV